MNSRFSSSIFLVLLSALVVGTLSGCSDEPDSAPVDETGNRAESQSFDLLGNAIDMLQPNRLGVSSDYSTALAVLNDWLSNHEERFPEVEVPIGSLDELIDDSQRNLIGMERFVSSDCDHVRMALLSRRILDRVRQETSDEFQRVDGLLKFVKQQIAIIDEKDALPFDPFQVLVHGRGTIRDRVWVFSELLRQMRLDCVFLAASGDSTDGLLGICLQRDMLLIDPALGMILPDDGLENADGSLTWAELLELTQWPERLDGSDEAGYRFDLPAVRQFQPRFIAGCASWSARMKRLQSVMTGDRDLVVYRPFPDDGRMEGARAAAAGAVEKWTVADVGIWNYPDQRLRQAADPNDDEALKLRRAMLVMAAPLMTGAEQQVAEQLSLEIAKNRSEQEGGSNSLVNIRDPEVPSLLKTRIMQLEGDIAGAVSQFQSLRARMARLAGASASGEFQRAHRVANDAATYWLAICQMDESKWSAVVNSTRQYRRLFPRGNWLDDSLLIEATCLALDDRIPAARKAAAGISPDSPSASAARMLIRNLELRETQSGNESESPDAEAP